RGRAVAAVTVAVAVARNVRRRIIRSLPVLYFAMSMRNKAGSCKLRLLCLLQLLIHGPSPAFALARADHDGRTARQILDFGRSWQKT
ncbi:MAG TPA: hypothetical protein VGC82_19670, partial [Rhodopila sp.]